MRHVTFYHRSTGVLHPTTLVASDDGIVALNTPADHLVIDQPLEGRPLDPLSQRVDVTTGAIVDWQPPQPSADHRWNADAKRWQLCAAAAKRQAKRAVALAQIHDLELAQARPMRELMRDPQNVEARKRLDAIEGEIAALRADL